MTEFLLESVSRVRERNQVLANVETGNFVDEVERESGSETESESNTDSDSLGNRESEDDFGDERSWTAFSSRESLDFNSVLPPLLGTKGTLTELITQVRDYEFSRGYSLQRDRSRTRSNHRYVLHCRSPKHRKREAGVSSKRKRSQAFNAGLPETTSLPVNTVATSIENIIETVASRIGLGAPTSEPSEPPTSISLPETNRRNSILNTISSFIPRMYQRTSLDPSSSGRIETAPGVRSVSELPNDVVTSSRVLEQQSTASSLESSYANSTHEKCGVFYRFSFSKVNQTWSIKAAHNEHTFSCTSKGRVPPKRAARLLKVERVVRERALNVPIKHVVKQIESFLPHQIDSVYGSRVIKEVDHLFLAEQRNQYKLLPGWAALEVAKNKDLIIAISLRLKNEIEYIRVFYNDEGSTKTISTHPGYSISPADEAAFEFMWINNPINKYIIDVMQPVISLDGTFCKHFGQVLLSGARVNGHNVALSIMFCRAENEKNHLTALLYLFGSVPMLGAKKLVFISDRDKGLINAVQAIQNKAHDILINKMVEDSMKSRNIPDIPESSVIIESLRQEFETEFNGKPEIHHVYDVPHLIRNLRSRFKNLPEDMLRALMYTESLNDFNNMLNQLDRIFLNNNPSSESPSIYLSSMNREDWAFAHQIRNGIRLFGWRSSGPGEELNKEIKTNETPIRKRHVPLSAVLWLEWCQKMQKRCFDDLKNFQEHIVANWLRVDENECDIVQLYTVRNDVGHQYSLMRRGEYDVRARVDLTDRDSPKCDHCNIMNQQARPCPHIIAVARFVASSHSIDYADLVLNWYHPGYRRVDLLRSRDNIPPFHAIPLSNVESAFFEPISSPPEIKKKKAKRGRPTSRDSQDRRIPSRGESEAQQSSSRRQTLLPGSQAQSQHIEQLQESETNTAVTGLVLQGNNVNDGGVQNIDDSDRSPITASISQIQPNSSEPPSPTIRQVSQRIFRCSKCNELGHRKNYCPQSN